MQGFRVLFKNNWAHRIPKSAMRIRNFLRRRDRKNRKRDRAMCMIRIADAHSQRNKVRTHWRLSRV